MHVHSIEHTQKTHEPTPLHQQNHPIMVHLLSYFEKTFRCAFLLFNLINSYLIMNSFEKNIVWHNPTCLSRETLVSSHHSFESKHIVI